MYKGKILVVGATGNSGREMLAQLSSRRIRPRAMVRNIKTTNLSSDTVDVVEGDLNDPKSLEKALEGITGALVTTSIHPEAEIYFSNFFQAAVHAEVDHLVKISAIGADPASPSRILRQHGKSDEQLRKSGIKYTILRPNSFFQNMLFQSRLISRRSKFSLPLGNSRQSIVDVRDVAEAAVKVLTEKGYENKTYDLTGPESLSCHDVARQLSEVTNRAIKYMPITTETAEQSMLSAGIPEWNASSLAEIQALFATSVFSKTTEELKLVLGKEPRRFSEFAVEHAPNF